MLEIRLHLFEEAKQVLRGKAISTPLVPTSFLKTQHGNNIFLKAENLQPSGSFKIRGATFAISRLSPQQQAAGVVAYSTGNHAQAVALAASKLGVKSTIVMSPDALPFKIAATKRYGAQVVIVPVAQRRQYTEQLASSTGAYLIPPYDHPDVITGQGTIGLEILDALEPAAIFVPVGGGGLISGIAMAVKQRQPSVKIIGVEPELENDGVESFHSGNLKSMNSPSTSIADAVKIPSLGELTYPIICTYVDDMITVTEKQIAEATKTCCESAHLFTEPSGALALAGALIYPESFSSNKPVICIDSGGNTLIQFLCEQI